MKPNYKNACVYKLCCKNPTIKDIYVGSTCNFRVRKTDHKSKCNNPKSPKYNIYVYRFIRDHGGFENWDMILLDNVDCEDKQTLHKIERYYLEKLGATLNKQIPTRTDKEYNEDNKEKRREYKKNNKNKIIKQMKEWKEQNKEHIKKYSSNYRKQSITCICGTEIKKFRFHRHKKTKKHRVLISEIKKPLHIELLTK